MSSETQQTSNGFAQGKTLKEHLYGKWIASVERKARLNEQITRKALDIPEDDDMHIDQSRTIHAKNVYLGKKSKLGTLAKLALGGALLASGAGAGFAIPILWSALKPKPVPVVPQGTDSDTATDIGFWDK